MWFILTNPRYRFCLVVWSDTSGFWTVGYYVDKTEYLTIYDYERTALMPGDTLTVV